jgi:hypothetical protein
MGRSKYRPHRDSEGLSHVGEPDLGARLLDLPTVTASYQDED